MNETHNFWRNRKTLGLGVCVLAAALATTSLITFAQQEQPTIKIEVRQVLVPVVVTDRAGHHVTGLKAGDFRVLEDGVEQKVVSFGTELAPLRATSQVEAKEDMAPILAPESAPQTGPAAPVRNTFLVVIDTLFLSQDSSVRIREGLQRVFSKGQGSDSNYALVALGRDLRIVRSVTRQPEQILAWVDSDALPRSLRESGGGALAAQEHQLRTMLEEYCRQCPCLSNSLPTGRPVFRQGMVDCDNLLDKMEHWTATAARERSGAIRSYLRRLGDIIAQLGKQPGKRILVMVSDGFDLWPGRDFYTMIAVYASRPSFPSKNPMGPLQRELDEVAGVATAANVVVYTVDSGGLRAPVLGVFSAEEPGDRFARRDAGPAVSTMITQVSALENARQDALAKLADVTGGVFFRGSNDLAKGMRQAFADEREYYVLAYAPTNRAEDGNFRKVRVELKVKKLKVRAKQGYWAPGPVSNP